MSNTTGRQTMIFNNVYVKNGFSVVGPKEKEGNLGKFFDMCLENDKFGEKCSKPLLTEF